MLNAVKNIGSKQQPFLGNSNYIMLCYEKWARRPNSSWFSGVEMSWKKSWNLLLLFECESCQLESQPLLWTVEFGLYCHCITEMYLYVTIAELCYVLYCCGLSVCLSVCCMLLIWSQNSSPLLYFFTSNMEQASLGNSVVFGSSITFISTLLLNTVP